jgi:hypothetical protein
MGLNFLHVSDHSWAEKMFTDMRNRTMAYLERKDRSLILAPLLTTLEKGIKTCIKIHPSPRCKWKIFITLSI